MVHFNKDMKLKTSDYGFQKIQQLSIDFLFKVIIRHLSLNNQIAQAALTNKKDINTRNESSSDRSPLMIQWYWYKGTDCFCALINSCQIFGTLLQYYYNWPLVQIARYCCLQVLNISLLGREAKLYLI